MSTVTVTVYSEDIDLDTINERVCVNCGGEIHTPDEKTGLIHKSGKYACYDDKGRRLETVAK